MLYVYRYNIIKAFILSLLSSVIMFSAPKSISLTVSFIKNVSNKKYSNSLILEFTGLILAVIMVNLLKTVIISHMKLYMASIGISIGENINQMMFEKGLKVNIQFKNEGESEIN